MIPLATFTIAALAILPQNAPPASDKAGFLTETVQRLSLRDAARRAVAKLIGDGKLDALWGECEPEWPTRRWHGGERYWVVMFRDAANADPAKRQLFVTLSDDGAFVSADHHLH